MSAESMTTRRALDTDFLWRPCQHYSHRHRSSAKTTRTKSSAQNPYAWCIPSIPIHNLTWDTAWNHNHTIFGFFWPEENRSPAWFLPKFFFLSISPTAEVWVLCHCHLWLAGLLSWGHMFLVILLIGLYWLYWMTTELCRMMTSPLHTAGADH